MARHDLQVSFTEKNEVKQLGARWDAGKKVWYVPDGVDTAAFQRWLPEVNIRASRYYVAETSRPCWKCAEQTRVYGFLLPAGHEVLECSKYPPAYMVTPFAKHSIDGGSKVDCSHTSGLLVRLSSVSLMESTDRVLSKASHFTCTAGARFAQSRSDLSRHRFMNA